jgi:GNAT superfamily N-acetyltransferase
MEYNYNEEPHQSTVSEVVSLWNASLGSHFPLEERLYRQQALFKKQNSALFVARKKVAQRKREDGQMVGAALVRIDATFAGAKEAAGARASQLTGYVSFVVVAPDERGKGIGTELLSLAESWCKGQGAQTVRLGSDYPHFFPGVPVSIPPQESSLMGGAPFSEDVTMSEFFAKRGYRADWTEYDLIADLQKIDLGNSPSEAFAQPEYHFSLCSDELRPATLEFLSTSFPGRWYQEMVDGFENGLQNEDVALAVQNDSEKVVGFARIGSRTSTHLCPGLFWRGLLGPNSGALGPIGVDSSCRGKGLGLSLLRASLSELKRRGVDLTVIDWTDLVGFYGKLGFRPWKAYLGMSKQL